MSADLFAEFANNPTPPPQQQQQPSSNVSGGIKQPVSKDPFDFGFSSNISAVTPSPIDRWPSIPSQSGGLSGWNTGPVVSEVASIPGASNDEDDGWGDFATAEPTAAPTTKPFANDPFGGFTAPPKEPEPKPRLVRAPTIDLMTNTLVDIRNEPVAKIELEDDSSWDLAQKKLNPRMKSTPSDPNVLFDADDFELQEGEEDEDDDEFGDFETVTPAPAQPKADPVSLPVPAPAGASNSTALLDLLSLDEPPQPLPQANTQKKPPPQLLGALSFGAATSSIPNPPKSPSFQERNPFPGLEIKTAPTIAAAKKCDDPKSASPVTAWPKVDHGTKSSNKQKDDDDWGAWDDVPSSDANIKGDIDNADLADNWDWDTNGSPEPIVTKSSDSDPPPINVPPPSVILSIFPDLFNSGNSLFKPIAGQNSSIKQQILTNPKAVQFLQGYILLATTAARVIAGRKHRWHRDKILAKSMSISAAGSKGMKLAGVDKTQSAREDREAADVAAVWREHVGRLRSAVAAANAAGKSNLKVPELSENLHVQTAKLVPTAPKACIICGLKREERVSKVDYDVEDSFGEWWVDHWGHRACKNFWVEHEQKLRQR